MKLLKRANLLYQQDRSDKVYEVDLCGVGPEQYVVNFRYGRRGAALVEGSKTEAPVGLAEAQRIFDKLVESKIKKGYRQITAGAAAATSGAPTETPATPPSSTNVNESRQLGPREQAIVARLADPAQDAGQWSLDRAIWRAGELAIAEAEPHLIAILQRSERSTGDSSSAREALALRRYCTAWALARCGGAAAVPHLRRRYDDADEQPRVRRIAAEALRQLYSGDDKAAFIAGLLELLPADLARLARTGPAVEFERELRAQLRKGKDAAFDALHTCYLVDNEHVRPALLSILADAPLSTGWFRVLRALFKAAELRRDGEVFGLLGYRFENTPATYRYRWSSADTSVPFQARTRQYLRRRVWRTLRRMGEDGDPAYVKMAVGVLLPFTDADAGQPKQRRIYRWRRPETVLQWDVFAGYWAFSHILFGDSPRYRPDDNGRAFRCADGYSPGDPAPAAREEAFPALWEQTPHGLLHLLDESACGRVHAFAVKTLRACPGFLDQLDVNVVVMLLGKGYAVTVSFGLELARRLYRPEQPDLALLGALADCAAPEGRDQARRWIHEQRERFANEVGLMAGLALSRHEDTRRFAADLLTHAALTDSTARALIGKIVAGIGELGADGDERIRGAGAVLLACFSGLLAGIGADVIRDLLAHPAVAAQELAGSLLLGHAELSSAVPDDILVAMLDSEHESVRAVGARLFGQLGESALLERKDLLVHLSLAKHAELREGVRPVLGRIATANPLFARELADAFTEALMHKAHDGVHTHLLAALKNELRAHLAHLTADRVLALLHHAHPHAQELGGVLLATNLGPDQLTVRELVRLTSHEILAVRQGAWAMCEKALARLKQALPTAIRLLEAKWADSRQWAMALIRDRFTRDELTPSILVAICDSVRPDVQQFGRELIMQHFTDADGREYLVKLAEHPARSLQLFVTNYLERYAAGDPERVRELEPFFVAVLSRVNQGRIAKQRSIAFLAREAVENREIAEVAARIFARQSATIAITHKTALLSAMVQIARAHPDIEQPIEIVAPPLRDDGRDLNTGQDSGPDSSSEASRGV